MKRWSILTLFLMLALSQALVYGQSTGYIQIQCSPGVKIFLDGNYKGTTSADLGGLILENVPVGSHTIKAVKENYQPQEKAISLSSGQVFLFTVQPFIPKIEIKEEGEEAGSSINLDVGTLIIQSIPIECTISIPTLSIQQEKTKDKWSAEKVPVGTHQIFLSQASRKLKATVRIEQGGTTRVMANFISGLITDTLIGGGGAGSDKYGQERLKQACINMTLEYDNKTYNTVFIGGQCWLKENLNVGVMIVDTTPQRNNSVIEKYCYNNDLENCDRYGGLYQWNEAMQYTEKKAQGICPSGWHIPTESEFQRLSKAVRDNVNALKALGQSSDGGAGTNTSGFSALLAGCRSHDGGFIYLGYSTYFWSSSERGSYHADYLNLDYGNSAIGLRDEYKDGGFSVRCIED